MPDIPLHQHDARYYTEQEVKLRLKAKAETSHAHAHDDVSDFDAAVEALIASHEGETNPHSNYLLKSGASVGAISQPQVFTAGLQATWLDRPLTIPSNGSQFDDYTATYPAGWTEVDAPLTTNTNVLRGFWYIYGQGTNLWKYRRQVGGITTGNNSFSFGPLMWRLLTWTGDITYLLGLYRDNSGIDEQSFVRLNLTYDSAAGLWKVRGESKDGTTQTNGSWVNLASPLPQMPLHGGVVVRSTSTNLRVYVGSVPFAAAQMMIHNINTTIAWGTAPWLQVELAARPATGNDDWLYIGGHDRGSEA